eukprot:m.258945 g.258945  ORF g.258945 m.258945 type:complete len:2013 (+) comp15549_c1_seq6:290-6328(+)
MQLDLRSFTCIVVFLATLVCMCSGLSFQLSNTSIPVSPSGRDVVISLSTWDLNQLKTLVGLATAKTNTYVSLNNTVRDMSGNMHVPVLQDAPYNVRIFSDDEQAPELLSFRVNVTANHFNLHLTFDEPIVPATVNFSALKLHAGNGTLAPSYILSDGQTLSQNNDTVLKLRLLKADLLDMFALDDLFFVDQAHSYLTGLSHLVQDMRGNPTATSEQLQATDHVEDIVAPFLLNATLDMDSAVVTLFFSEIINPDTLNVSTLTLQSLSTNTSQILDGTQSQDPDSVLLIHLTQDVMFLLKKDRNLATSVNTSLVSFESSLLEDMSGNTVQPQPPTLASAFTPDTTQPVLSTFHVNLTGSTITLEFSEPVDPLIFNAAAITLHNQSNTSTSSFYTLTDSTVVSTLPSSQMTVRLSNVDQDALALTEDLAVSLHTTFLTCLSVLVVDMTGNQVVNITQPLPAASFVTDLVRPSLAAFSLNMTSESIQLTFSEAINIASFDTSQLQLCSPDGLVCIQIQGELDTAEDGSVMSVSLANSTIFAMQLQRPTFFNKTSTLLKYNEFAFSDQFGNRLQPGNQSAFNFVADANKPRMVSYNLNFNNETITMYFSEVVDAATLQCTALTLQDDSSNSTAHYTLTGCNVTSSNGLIHTVALLTNDLNELKAMTALATGINKTYLSASSLLVSDMTGNVMVPITNNSALQVASFTADATRPQLINFAFNLNDEYIMLTFSETVNAHTGNASAIVLKSSSSPSAFTHRITAGSFVYTNSTVVRVDISRQDTNELKRIQGLCDSQNTTWLDLDASLVTDMVGLSVVPRSNVQTIVFVPDTTPPRLLSYTFNMTSEVLSMTFDETMDASATVVGTKVVFVGNASSSASYTLLGGNATSADGTVVSVQLDQDDVFALKVDRGLVTQDNNTRVQVLGGSLFDMSSNTLLPTGTVDVAPGGFSPDTTPPRAVSLYVNLNQSQIILDFDEPVETGSCNFTALVALGELGVATEYRLTGANTTSEDGTQIVATLSVSDINAIKELTDVWVSNTSARLSVEAAFVDDMYGNAVVPVDLSALVFIDDVTRPYAVQASLNMTSEILELVFVETVNVSSMDVLAITLQSSATVSSTTHRHSLTGGSVLTVEDGTVVRIQLTVSDTNEMKRKRIGLSRGSSWVVFDSGLVLDMNEQPVRPLTNGVNAMQVTRFVADAVAPSLVRVSLNMDTGRISLTFSETMLASSVSVTALTLQEAASVGGMAHQVTSASTVVSNDGTVQEVSLSTADLNEVKRLWRLCTSNETTFVSYGSNFATDIQGNNVTAVSAGTAFQAFEVLDDATSPTLVSYTFDMSGVVAYINLTFSETVQGATLNGSAITLYSAGSNSSGVGVSSVGLGSGSTFVAASNGTELQLALSKEDLDAVKRETQLGVSVASVWLAHSRHLVEDMNGNSVVAVLENATQQVSVYVGDATRPTLVSFALDMDQGKLSMTFSETMKASSLMKTRLTLASNPCTGVNFTLTGGGSTVQDGTVLNVTLSNSDMNELKSLPFVAWSLNTTFLSFVNAAAVTDMSNLLLNGVDHCNDAVQAQVFWPDVTEPRILAFRVDMTAKTMELDFSEAVDPASYNASLVILHNSVTSVGLTPNSTLTLIDRDTALITLCHMDFLRVQAAYPMASAQTQTRLAVGSFISDFFNNSVEAVPQSAQLNASAYIEDLVRPALVSFTLDMNQLQVGLTFSEVINTTTLVLSQLYLANMDGSLRVALSSASNATTGVYSHTMLVSLGFDDAVSLQLHAGVCVSKSSCYLGVMEGAILDLNGNNCTAAENSGLVQVGTYVPDVTQPTVSGVGLDLNMGVLYVNMSEAINASTVSIAEFTLQDSAPASRDISTNATAESFTLTTSTAARANAFTIEIFLSHADLNNIKRLQGLAIDGSTTYLQLTGEAVRDMAGNAVTPYGDAAAIGASAFTGDTTKPQLESFDFIQNPGGSPTKLRLRFSETVDASSLDVTKMVLQNKEVVGGNTLRYRLTSGNVQSVDEEP